MFIKILINYEVIIKLGDNMELTLKKIKKFIMVNNREKLSYLKRLSRKIIVSIMKNEVVVKEIEKALKSYKHKEVVIFPATVDYSFMFQRPQQLANAFAKKGYLVLYGTLNGQTDSVTTIQKISENLFLIHEAHFPYLETLLDKNKTIYYCMWPNNIKHLSYLPYKKIIYDYMDELSLLGLPYDELYKSHMEMLGRADVITVSAIKLYEQIPVSYREKTLVINNAVSEEFIKNLNDCNVEKSLFKIKNTYKKVIGYYGAIAKWMDFELVEYLALKLNEYAFVYIGPIFEVQENVNYIKAKYKNVFFISQKDYKDLPGFLKGFDVCTIPFVKNEITEAVSPVKLFEYMASKHPIVTIDLTECQKYKSVITATNKEDFLQQIEKALKLQNNINYLNLLQKEMLENTWEHRVEQIMKYLNEVNL